MFFSVFPIQKHTNSSSHLTCHQAGTGHLSLMIKLESDVKRLKCDLQLSRNRENELRDQIVCYMSRCLVSM